MQLDPVGHPWGDPLHLLWGCSVGHGPDGTVLWGDGGSVPSLLKGTRCLLPAGSRAGPQAHVSVLLITPRGSLQTLIYKPEG